MVRKVAIVLTVTAALGAGLYYLSEARRLGARFEQTARRNRQLEHELAVAIGQREEQSRVLAEQIGKLDARRRALRQESQDALRPMPEGVRLALIAINECLSEDGFAELRFLHAREIDHRSLRLAEAMERDPGSLASTLYVANKVQLELDRSRESLTLRFFDGVRVHRGEREELVEEGLPVVLRPVNGRMWEARLGYLLEVEGSYPEPAEETRQRPRMDRFTKQAWLSRLDGLLERAGTDVAYRVDRFAGLEGGVFADVLLLGYDDGKSLSVAMEAERMSVTVDEATGSVALLLHKGVLRKSGGETTIPSDGYRILLPSLTRDDAMKAMLGMVVLR